MAAPAQHRTRYPIEWLFPVLLIVLLLTVFPVVHTIWTSLHRVMVLLPGTPFVGFDNYLAVFEKASFWTALKNTFRFTVFSAPLTVLIGFGVAKLLLAKFRGRTLVRSVVILPWVLPGAIAAILWMWIFHPSWGILNLILFKAGIIDKYIPWLTDPTLAKMTVIVAHTWTQYPFAAVLLMAALVSVDPGLYEAAKLDGATPWQRFRYITFPKIKPIVVILLIYSVLVGVTSFDVTYALTAGGPGTATILLSFSIWRESFSSLNFGTGSAVAFIVVLISIGLLIGILKALPADLFGAQQR